MAITHVQTVTGTGDASSTTLTCTAMSVTSGNFIHASTKWETNNTLTSITDTAGNTYSLETRKQYAGTAADLQGGYAVNIAAHASNVVQFNYGASVDFRRGSASEYSGVATSSAFDQQNQNSAASGTSVTTGNVTTTQNDEVICCFAGAFTGQSYSNRLVNGSAANARATLSDYAAWDLIVSATFTGGGAITQSVSGEWAGAIATFKAAAGGGGAAKKRILPGLLAQRALSMRA